MKQSKKTYIPLRFIFIIYLIQPFFVVVHYSFDIDSFLNALNNKFNSIEFTVGYKNSRSLTFLDLLITLNSASSYWVLYLPKKKKTY